MSTPALALSYFVGYSRSEARAFVSSGPAPLVEVVEAFSRAVARHRVARETYQAFLSGWRVAEGMSA